MKKLVRKGAPNSLWNCGSLPIYMTSELVRHIIEEPNWAGQQILQISLILNQSNWRQFRERKYNFTKSTLRNLVWMTQVYRVQILEWLY